VTARAIYSPAYRYGFLLKAIYDGDTIVGDLDMYDHVWKANEIIRLYGINCQEIKRSKAKGLDADDVQVGFDHRDELIRFLGLDPADFQRVLVAPPYPPQIASTYSAMCAGPSGITVLDGYECWLYQHGLRHMGEIELARGLVGLEGMTS